MADGQKGGDSLHDNALGWGILLIVFAVVLWLFWYFFDAEIRNILRWIRYSEMWLISWFVDNNYTVPFKNMNINWQKGFEDTGHKWNAEELTYDHLSYFNALAMQPLKNVFIGLLGLAATWCIFWGPQTQYRKKLNLETLIARQSLNFPVISPFINFNPSNQPPRAPGSPVPAELPLFAEALGPEEWLAYNEIPVPDGSIDRAAAARAFQKQLGKRWKGAQALEPYQQILLAAFCLKASRKRNDADDLLGRLAKCWDHKGGLRLNRDRKLLTEARKILRTKNLAQKTLAEANRHAFTATALLRALAFAREEGGVLAPAQFVWLRGHDRTLWYPMNNLGRQSFHMEALGAMSHYKQENLTKRPIPVPKMENAVTTIIEYMASRKARPIPKLDYSDSDKRGVKKAV